MTSLEQKLDAAVRRRKRRTGVAFLLIAVLVLLLAPSATICIACTAVATFAVWVHYSEDVEDLEKIIHMEDRHG